MGTGYTRNDTSNNIANGNVIDAADLDGEFDAIEAAFELATGHTHDGTANEGAPVSVVGPVQEYLADGAAFYPKATATYTLGKVGATYSNAYVDSITLGGTAVTSTAAELNILDGVTSTTAELNILDGVTATTAELNYTDGVTSNVQTQLNAKQPLDTDLTAIAGLASTDSNFIVGSATGWVAETGATVRTSLGLGTAATTASTDYATSTQGTTADNALPKAGGTMTGNITMPALGTVDGRDLSVDGSKLDGIEAAADVTDVTNVTAAGALMDSELAGLAAVKATTGTFLTADQSKLDGIEAAADVTDATNVTAAGALMDSELTSIASVKALDQGVAVADSPAFTGLQSKKATTLTDASETVIDLTATTGAYGRGPAIDFSVDWNGEYTISNVSSQNVTGGAGYGGILAFSTNGAAADSLSEHMRIDSAGNVGIGTITPSTALDVVGTVTAGDVNITGPTPILTLTDDDVADKYTKIFNASGNTYIESRNGSNNGIVVFRGLGGGTTTELMRLNSAGRLGIGTNNPASALDVAGTVTATAFAGDGSALTSLPSLIKAWVNFNGDGVVAIVDSLNVSSLTDNGTGDYTINFTTNMTDANYVTLGSAYDTSIGTTRPVGPRTQTVSGSTVEVVNASGNPTNPEVVHVAVIQ